MRQIGEEIAKRIQNLFFNRNQQLRILKNRTSFFDFFSLLNKLIILIDFMINHHPYNLPERPPQKHARIFTDLNSPQYRHNDSVDNSQNYSHYANRQHARGPLSPSAIMKKSNLNLDETPPSYRSPTYQAVANDVKQFVAFPKSPGPSNTANILSLGSVNARGHSQRVNSL